MTRTHVTEFDFVLPEKITKGWRFAPGVGRVCVIVNATQGRYELITENGFVCDRPQYKILGWCSMEMPKEERIKRWDEFLSRNWSPLKL